MKQPKESLDTVLEAPGAKMQGATWGGMSVSYNFYGKGTDFTPILKGLKDDMCQCPHWGYILKGALHIRHSDGSEEVLKTGDVWYTPPGHTGWAEEDTEVIEFSPEKDFSEVFRHVKKQLGS